MQSSAITSDWKSYHGWANKKIRSSVQGGMLVRWIMAIGWAFPTALTLPLISLVIEERNPAGVLVLIFPLVAVILFYRALSPVIGEARFGQVVFEMSPYPGIVGGQIGGKIKGPLFSKIIQAQPNTKFRASLCCMHFYTSRVGSDETTHNDTIWSKSIEPTVILDANESCLALSIDTPEKLRGADLNRNFNHYYWQLTVRGEMRGVDFVRQYNLPVFKTAIEDSKVA
ncbi:hypothetical protein A9Q99_01025 [Gammaproteobacteria bacterium 45_16_T64]|nr:hypothetical protein A9Q99_01025 [Gammaproteobacteria bacterium 45_16_T64]